MRKNTKGFTIVELLIVIVVIGILAAIVIVAFNGIQERANTTSVKSDLSSFSKKIEMSKIDSISGTYPQTAPNLVDLKMAFSKGAYMTGTDASINLLYCHSGSYANYALLALTKNGKKMYISNTVSGPQEYTGSNTWNEDNYADRCRTVLPSSNNAAQSGYSRTDTPQWRPWTGA